MSNICNGMGSAGTTIERLGCVCTDLKDPGCDAIYLNFANLTAPITDGLFKYQISKPIALKTKFLADAPDMGGAKCRLIAYSLSTV